MSADSLKYRIEDAQRWLSANGWEKGKLLGISALLTVLVAWLVINLAGAMWPERAGGVPETPGWNLVQELNAALLAQPAFADTAFVLESERPLKLKLVGAVEVEEDLDDLEVFAAKLRPEKDYEIQVELLHEITNVQPQVEGGLEPEGDGPEEPETGR